MVCRKKGSTRRRQDAFKNTQIAHRIMYPRFF